MSTRRAASHEPPTERAALVGLVTRKARGADPDILFDELAGLAQAAGAAVVLRAMQERSTPDPATLIGKGKAEGLAVACDAAGATLAIFDNELHAGADAQSGRTAGPARRSIEPR